MEDLGWHWLGRVRGHVGLRKLAEPQAAWQPAQQLYRAACAVPRALGQYALTASKAMPCDLVLVKQASKHRTQCRRDGLPASGGRATKMQRCAREPWLLAYSSSRADRTPRQITRLYALRMQIESSFRDLKSHRYGCAFEDTQTRTAERLEMLLLIHLLATLLAWVEGLAGAMHHEHRFRLSILRCGWERLRVCGLVLTGSIARLLARLQTQVRLAPSSP